MAYSDFVEAVLAKKVEGVVFEPPSGSEAFAIIGGKVSRSSKLLPAQLAPSTHPSGAERANGRRLARRAVHGPILSCDRR